MPSKEPAGLDQALDAEMQDVEREPLEKGDEHMEEVEEEPLEKGEEEWRPGMRLSASHPSWMWKQNRKDLASRDGRNKAGKKIGKGTTSLNRAARRAAEQPRKNKDYWGSLAQQDSNPWQRDEGWWSNPWQRDRWEHSWERDDGWWEHFLEWEQSEREHSDPCEREERARSSGLRRRRRRRRRTRHSPTRSQSPCSDQRSEGSVTASPRSVASAGSGRSSSALGKGKKLVRQKKEQDRQAWLQEKEKTGLADIPEEDDRPFSKMLEEMKKKEAEKEEALQHPWKREQKLLPAHHPWKREQKLLPALHHPFHLSTPRQNPWKREQKLLPAHHPWKREHLSTPRQNPWKREQKLLPAHHPWKREHLPPVQLHPWKRVKWWWIFTMCSSQGAQFHLAALQPFSCFKKLGGSLSSAASVAGTGQRRSKKPLTCTKPWGHWKSFSQMTGMAWGPRVHCVSNMAAKPCSMTVWTFCKVPLKKGLRSTQSKHHTNSTGGGQSLEELPMRAWSWQRKPFWKNKVPWRQPWRNWVGNPWKREEGDPCCDPWEREIDKRDDTTLEKGNLSKTPLEKGRSQNTFGKGIISFTCMFLTFFEAWINKPGNGSY